MTSHCLAMASYVGFLKIEFCMIMRRLFIVDCILFVKCKDSLTNNLDFAPTVLQLMLFLTLWPIYSLIWKKIILQFRYYWISPRRLIQLNIIYYLINYSTMVLEGWLWSGSVVTYLVEANMLNIMMLFLNLGLSHVGFLRVRYLALFCLLFIQMTFLIL